LNGSLVLESQTEDITFTPNEAARSDGAKVIEAQIEAGWQHGQIVGPYSGAKIRHIGNLAGAHPRIAIEEKQRAFLYSRPAD
jgi:hypothetical protein